MVSVMQEANVTNRLRLSFWLDGDFDPSAGLVEGLFEGSGGLSEWEARRNQSFQIAPATLKDLQGHCEVRAASWAAIGQRAGDADLLENELHGMQADGLRKDAEYADTTTGPDQGDGLAERAGLAADRFDHDVDGVTAGVRG